MPTSEYYKELANMPTVAVHAGNVTECNSLQVLKRASYELRKKQELHTDMMQEVQMQHLDWMSSECAGHPFGFVQAISDLPFFCSFYLRQQLNVFVKCCCTDLEATGTVVKNVPDNRRILYYCINPCKSNLPVLEFLSSQHTAEMLMYLKDLFMHYAWCNCETAVCRLGLQLSCHEGVTEGF